MAHKWTDDDDLLVIDLYLRLGPLGSRSSEVATVARLIGTTPDSVALALQNVRFLDTGRGRENYAQHMRVNWEKWGDQPAALRDRVAIIRRRASGGRSSENQPLPSLSDEKQARINERMEARRRERGCG